MHSVDGGNPQEPLSRRGAWAPPALLLFVLVPLLIWRIDVWPAPWFDEGYSTHPARALAERGLYGTISYDHQRPLDAGITTGPPVIIPIAVSFALFGAGMAQSRLVIAAFACMATVCLYLIASFMFGRATAWVATLFVLAAPALGGVNLVLLGRQVLGEVPALALISLGLVLWFRSWGRGSLWLSAVAGLICGIGLTCKMQTAIGVVPALFVVGCLRGAANRRDLAASLAMPIAALSAAGAWLVFSQLAVPSEFSAEYARTLSDSVRTHVFLPPALALPRNASSPVTAVLLVTCSLVGLRLWRARAHGAPTDDRLWAELALGSIIGVSSLWLVTLSIGWPRYAFLALLLSTLLLGAYAHLALRSALGARRLPIWLDPSIGALLVLIAVGQAVLWTRADVAGQGGAAERIATVVDTRVPRDAVIESWEWEVDALSNHWQFHHPSHIETYTAIRQLFHERRDFDLNYDLLQANPDYLLTGPFSAWTGIYPDSAIERQFVKIAQDGPYTLYRRAAQ
jgi:hypothetical protein